MLPFEAMFPTGERLTLPNHLVQRFARCVLPCHPAIHVVANDSGGRRARRLEHVILSEVEVVAGQLQDARLLEFQALRVKRFLIRKQPKPTAESVES